MSVQTPLHPNQSANTSLAINYGTNVQTNWSYLRSSLPVSSGGPVMRMDPLCVIQVAVKNSIGVHYLSPVVNTHVLFTDDGKMGKRIHHKSMNIIIPVLYRP